MNTTSPSRSYSDSLTSSIGCFPRISDQAWRIGAAKSASARLGESRGS